jgi:hypothetical protein
MLLRANTNPISPIENSSTATGNNTKSTSRWLRLRG